jgi:carbonic anhydrase
MVDILSKVKEFRASLNEEMFNLFHELSHGQKPHTLFISCSDSRVVPEVITNSKPGELFVVRNIANIVPRYEDDNEVDIPMKAAIEYAVLVLKVQNVVVCGHSSCGGCAAMDFNRVDESIKNVYIHVGLVKDEVISKVGANEHLVNSRSEVIEKVNVITQVEHLMSYPFINHKLDNGEIKIFGWYFHIPTAKVFNYNFLTKEFEEIK